MEYKFLWLSVGERQILLGKVSHSMNQGFWEEKKSIGTQSFFFRFFFNRIPACDEKAVQSLCLGFVLFTWRTSQFVSRDLQLTDALKVIPKTQLEERPLPTFYPLYPQGSQVFYLLLFAHEDIILNLTCRRMPSLSVSGLFLMKLVVLMTLFWKLFLCCS